MAEVLYRDECYAIIGACFAVYNKLGHCFTEPICHECLEIELAHLGIPFASKPPLTLQYRGQTLQHAFAPDSICFDKIILEIKAVESLIDKHRAQTINYLHASGCDLGLLANFGSFPKLQSERFLHSRLRPPHQEKSFESARLHEDSPEWLDS
jgi:GxxExxY protein